MNSQSRQAATPPVLEEVCQSTTNDAAEGAARHAGPLATVQYLDGPPLRVCARHREIYLASGYHDAPPPATAQHIEHTFPSPPPAQQPAAAPDDDSHCARCLSTQRNVRGQVKNETNSAIVYWTCDGPWHTAPASATAPPAAPPPSLCTRTTPGLDGTARHTGRVFEYTYGKVSHIVVRACENHAARLASDGWIRSAAPLRLSPPSLDENEEVKKARDWMSAGLDDAERRLAPAMLQAPQWHRGADGLHRYGLVAVMRPPE